MRLGGKSDEQGTLGGSIKIPESGKGLTRPKGHIIKSTADDSSPGKRIQRESSATKAARGRDGSVLPRDKRTHLLRSSS